MIDLVLHGDVRPSAGLVLRSEASTKGVGEVTAHAAQSVAIHAQRYATSERHRAGDAGWRRLGHDGLPQLGQTVRRDVVEHGQVRLEVVAVGWEVSATQGIEPACIVHSHQRCDDDGRRSAVGGRFCGVCSVRGLCVMGVAGVLVVVGRLSGVSWLW